MKRFALMFIAMSFISWPAIAQQQKLEKPKGFSEVDRLKLANIDLRAHEIVKDANAQIEPLELERERIIAKIVHDNPGYTWHYPEREGDGEGLVKIEKQPQKLPNGKPNIPLTQKSPTTKK